MTQSVKPNVLKIKVQKITPEAQLPVKKERELPDAGWDMFSAENVIVPGFGKALVHTGIAMAIPEGWFGNIRNRSGQALTTPLTVDAGIIDPGYRGEIGIILVNNSEYPYDVRVGDRIAQILFEKIADVELQEAKKLPASNRGKDGFGSTGK